MKQIKILHFIPSLRSGGMERQLLELIYGFRSKPEFRFELILISPKIDYNIPFKSETPITVIERKTKYDIRLFFNFLGCCLKIRPDIIHSWESMCSVFALPVAKLLGIKFVNGFIRDAPSKISFLNKNKIRALLTFPFSDAIISNSKVGLKVYKATQVRAQCIHNGFALERINDLQDPEFVRASMGLLPNQIIIGMVANFFDNKDQKIFIRACQLLMRNRIDIIAILVGNGPNLHDCIRGILPEFKHQFMFLGQRMDVENIINIFNIGVLTTNTKVHGEGISNSVMEYMALSKPVVVNNSGGNIELVRDGETGFIVDNNSVNDLANKIEYLINNPDVAEIYGAAGAKCIANDFSLNKMVESYSVIYRRLAESN